MAKVCDITGKKGLVGGRYSNRVRATQFNPQGLTKRQPNIQRKRVYIPELKKTVVLNLSTTAIKTIKKNGVYKTLKKAKVI
jgi:large subunit ribosomal protein L28